MGKASSSANVRQAALHLGQLLLKKPYRNKWIKYERQRERHGHVHQAAVTSALTEYIDHHRHDPRYRDVGVTSLSQRVSKALKGTILSPATLQLFIDAFEMKHEDATRLERLYQGTEKVRVLVGASGLPPETAAALGPIRYRTTSLHEHHYIGDDGMPIRHRTQQVIESIDDVMERYPYRFDTNALTVEVDEGGTLAGRPYHVRGNVYAVDILLDEPLSIGDETMLTYQTLFHYEKAPKREFRRVAHGRMEDMSLRVEFSPNMLPSRVWWAVWDGIDGEIVQRESVRLRAQSYVYRHMEYVEDAVVGFCWE